MKRTMVFDLEIDPVSLRKRLAHQPRLQPRQLIAHFAFELGPGRERSDRIHHHDIDAAGAHQRVGDFEGLFTGVGLRDQELIDVDAQFLGIAGIERVFRIHIGGNAAFLLDLGHHVQGQGRLAGGFRTIDLDHPPTGETTDAERDVEPERARRDRIGIHRPFALAQLHDRALAEGAIDLGKRRLERALLIAVFSFHHPKNRL